MIIEEPDEELGFSLNIIPPEERADQSEPVEVYRRTSNGNLAEEKDGASINIATDFKRSETSLVGMSPDINGPAFNPIPDLHGEPKAGAERGQVDSMHEGDDDKNLTSVNLDSLDSNDSVADGRVGEMENVEETVEEMSDEPLTWNPGRH
ncbi:hypothetical protein OY671_007415 [Metschnikowia pulcherrima]|nr:hypothetical protein OY671_007415 [Metschnikowia pulcherrima]